MAKLSDRSAGTPTRAQAVARDLRQAILAGEFRGGERLRQLHVAKRFGVSTTPVREAFTILRREGLVEVDDHRGAVVVMPSIERLREIYEIRAVLEPMAAAAAAPRIDERTLAALDQLVERMADTADRDGYLHLHREFHDQIYRTAGRSQLQSLIISLEESATVYLRVLLDHIEDSDSAVAGHRLILDTLRFGDAEQARTAMAAHLRRNLELIELQVEETGTRVTERDDDAGSAAVAGCDTEAAFL